MNQQDLDAIKARAENLRWMLNRVASATDMSDRIVYALPLAKQNPRIDDDLFALLAEVERLQKTLEPKPVHDPNYVSTRPDCPMCGKRMIWERIAYACPEHGMPSL